MNNECRECRQDHTVDLKLIKEVSRIVLEESNIPECLQSVLICLDKEMNLRGSMITIHNRQTGKIYIKESTGISSRKVSQGVYSPGEGIIGRVVDSGTAITVPDIRNDKRFLNRTGSMDNNDIVSSFICVPVKAGNETLGALSVILPNPQQEDLSKKTTVLSVIGGLIYHSVRHSRDVEEELQRLRDENLRLHERLRDAPKRGLLIGTSNVMGRLQRLIEKMSASDATVLILGESGTGKSLVAQQIHESSARKDRAFVKLNCAAISENLIESELFGHERGSFTGAVERRIGRFEYAEGGTIFLDEIGEMGLSVQAKLLRILQEREYERVGANKTLKANVRVIAATNCNLEEKVKQGEFREDLYYRLAVVPIEVPPLRDRKADIILLADFFVDRYGRKNQKTVQRISTPVIDSLMNYHWPGNVRELENVIERAVILCDDGVIRTDHLPPSLRLPGPQQSSERYSGDLQSRLDSVEYEMIIDAVKTTRGNLSKASELLGLSRRQMGIRAEKYGIDFRIFRAA